MPCNVPVLFDQLEGFDSWLAALKAACALRGLGNGRPAPPLLPASVADRDAVRALLDEAGAARPALAAQAR